MHGAIVCRLENVRDHPNADKLKLATVYNQDIIVGINSNNGDLGLFFDCELALSLEFIEKNNIKYFPKNGRVRAQSFRGVKSAAFWCPVSYLDYIEDWDLSQLKENDVIDEYIMRDGIVFKICFKYISPKTKKQQNANTKKQFKSSIYFPKHKDTNQFDYEYQNIPEGSLITITSKQHGSSQRQTLSRIETLPSYFRMLKDRFKGKIQTHEHILGTRNVVIGRNYEGNYDKEGFRFEQAKLIQPYISENEVWYYEIVGQTEDGVDIMSSVSANKIKDSKLRKEFISKFGDQVNWQYGNPYNKCSSYVYRITTIDENQNETDYTWSVVKKKCKDAYIKHVSDLFTCIYLSDLDLNQIVHGLIEDIDGVGAIDPVTKTGLQEGVVIRVDTPTGHTYFLKKKCYVFKVLENIIKENNHVDIEESS